MKSCAVPLCSSELADCKSVPSLCRASLVNAVFKVLPTVPEKPEVSVVSLWTSKEHGHAGEREECFVRRNSGAKHTSEQVLLRLFASETVDSQCLTLLNLAQKCFRTPTNCTQRRESAYLQ